MQTCAKHLFTNFLWTWTDFGESGLKIKMQIQVKPLTPKCQKNEGETIFWGCTNTQ